MGGEDSFGGKDLTLSFLSEREPRKMEVVRMKPCFLFSLFFLFCYNKVCYYYYVKYICSVRYQQYTLYGVSRM